MVDRINGRFFSFLELELRRINMTGMSQTHQSRTGVSTVGLIHRSCTNRMVV